MNVLKVAWASLVLLGIALPCSARSDHQHAEADVDVQIVGAHGGRFRTIPVTSESPNVHRAYLEARDRAAYRIRVHNRTGGRVGLVIAVDGRNIISGRRSELERGERMYVLDAWESAEYEGWRTGADRVNEFYFTDWPDSYAEAFGDRSARGVIAVAVYRERQRPGHSYSAPVPELRERSAAAPGARSDKRGESEQPGTGFGEEIHSPSRRVAFDPQRSPAASYFIKYEWRDALCRRGVIECDRRERNRFWDEDERFGFAPYPPGRRVRSF